MGVRGLDRSPWTNDEYGDAARQVMDALMGFAEDLIGLRARWRSGILTPQEVTDDLDRRLYELSQTLRITMPASPPTWWACSRCSEPMHPDTLAHTTHRASQACRARYGATQRRAVLRRTTYEEWAMRLGTLQRHLETKEA